MPGVLPAELARHAPFRRAFGPLHLYWPMVDGFVPTNFSPKLKKQTPLMDSSKVTVA